MNLEPLTLPDGRPASAAWTLDETYTHVNHGSFGGVPQAAQQHQDGLRRTMEATPGTWFPALGAAVEQARASIAAFLEIGTDDAALVPNASGGASAVFNSLTVHRGPEIVVTDHGYGAVTGGAQRLARRWQGAVRTARIPLDASAAEAHEAIMARVTDATGLIIVDQVTAATARRLPTGTVAQAAKQLSVPVLVDAAHVPGLYARPLEGIDCNYWIGNMHKFACAPRPSAVLVAREPSRDDLYPLIDSWGAAEPFPQRFNQQGTMDATAMLATPAALGFIEATWGWDCVRTYATRLADYAEARVTAAFQEITGENHRVDVGMPVSALRLVRLPAGLAANRLDGDGLRERVAKELRIEAAFTSFAGTGYWRLSAHAYNTAADYDHIAERCVPMLCAWARENRARLS